MQAVGHHAARGAAAPGAYGDAVSLGVADKVGDDEKIVHIAHLLDHVQLVLQLLMDLGPAGKALGKALFTELLQIGKAVRLPRRQLEAGQVVVAEFEIVIAALRNGHRVVRRLLKLREEGAHLLFAFQIQLPGLKAHTVGVVHGLAHLDAHQHILIIGVLFFNIVGVVGQNQRDARLLMEPDQPLGGLFLFREAVVLNLQIKILRPEQRPKLQSLGFGPLVVVLYKHLGDGPGQTAGEADQPLRVLVQQRPVDAGLDVKAVGKGSADQIAEILIARLVLAQQHKMGIVVIPAMLLVAHVPGRHIYLAANDGLDPRRKAGLVKGHRAVHDPVVGDGQGGLPQGLGLFRDLVDTAGPVQQGIFRMYM